MIVRGMVDVSWVMETADIPHIPVLLIYPNILPLHMPLKKNPYWRICVFTSEREGREREKRRGEG